jgi:hypothetical protein
MTSLIEGSGMSPANCVFIKLKKELLLLTNDVDQYLQRDMFRVRAWGKIRNRETYLRHRLPI